MLKYTQIPEKLVFKRTNLLLTLQFTDANFPNFFTLSSSYSFSIRQLFICLLIVFIINIFDYHFLFALVCAIIVAFLVYNIPRYVVMQFDDFFVCLPNECCLLEKAEELNTSLYNAVIKRIQVSCAKYILKDRSKKKKDCISLEQHFHVIENRVKFQSRNSHIVELSCGLNSHTNGHAVCSRLPYLSAYGQPHLTLLERLVSYKM